MPLDLSQYEAGADTPEVAALKKTVAKVAKKYANRHGWCSVVDQALIEMGVTSKVETIKVVAATTFGFPVTTRVSVTDLLGKTEQQQHEVIAGKVGPSLTIAVSGGGVSGSIPFAVENITDLSVEARTPTLLTGGPRNTETGAWVYTSDTGRVLHHVPGIRIEDPIRIVQSDGSRLTGGRLWNEHSDYTYGVYTTSRSATGADCQRCSRALATN